MTAADKWAFLEPWRLLLSRVVRYVDQEELLVGSLHETLRCVRVDLFQYWVDEIVDHDHDTYGYDTETEFRDVYLTLLREALELIGCVLHYDKRAWRWLQPKYSVPTFYYETDGLEPCFEFSFHDSWHNIGGDSEEDLEDAMRRILLRVDTTGLSDEYVLAKLQLQDLVGAKFDPGYRVPVALVLAPRKQVTLSCISVLDSIASVCAFVHAASTPAFASSCFKLVAVTLLGWQLRVDEPVEQLLSALQLAQIKCPEVSLTFVDAHGVMAGKLLNLLCGLKPDDDADEEEEEDDKDDDDLAPWIIGDIGIHESTLQAFAQACTSLMQARSPVRLLLYEAFGNDPAPRAAKWRWLGYALSGDQGCATSIQHLRIEDASLSADDVRHFIGDITCCPYKMTASPPRFDPTGCSRCVRLSRDSCVQVGGQYWHTMDTLGMTDHDEFLVVDDQVTHTNRETMDVVVPGFGVCTVQCAAVIDAAELDPLPPSFQRFETIWSLQCGINSCEPEALQLLTHSFGSTLVQLKLSLGTEIVLDRAESTAFVHAFPVLEFLDLNHVSLGSMDELLTAYEDRSCSVRVLSMTNSFVAPDSMTRFATRLQDPTSRLAHCLREFRYLFEDFHDSADGFCPTIITMEGAAAFHQVLQHHAWLSFLEIGLVLSVYDTYASVLKPFDRAKTSALLLPAKLAFLSVLRNRVSLRSAMKKPRATGLYVPVTDRRDVLTHIWSFVRPPTTRLVSVICVPRED